MFKVRENPFVLTREQSVNWLYQMLPWNCRHISQVTIGTEDLGLQGHILLAPRR